MRVRRFYSSGSEVLFDAPKKSGKLLNLQATFYSHTGLFRSIKAITYSLLISIDEIQLLLTVFSTMKVFFVK